MGRLSLAEPAELESAFKAYRASFREGSPTCPVCFGRELTSDFEESETLEFVKDELWVVTACKSCGAKWREIWKLKRFMALVKTEGGEKA